MTDMCATNRHAAIKYNDVLAKGTRMENDDNVSWVQQMIADRDKRWCPIRMNKQLSPAERVGAKK